MKYQKMTSVHLNPLLSVFFLFACFLFLTHFSIDFLSQYPEDASANICLHFVVVVIFENEIEDPSSNQGCWCFILL